MKTGSQQVPKEPSSKPVTQVTPDPKLEKRPRRTLNAEYKLRILQEADACKHGELGALLRREKLYSNQLSGWRREYAKHGLAGLSKSDSIRAIAFQTWLQYNLELPHEVEALQRFAML